MEELPEHSLEDTRIDSKTCLPTMTCNECIRKSNRLKNRANTIGELRREIHNYESMTIIRFVWKKIERRWIN